MIILYSFFFSKIDLWLEQKVEESRSNQYYMHS